MKVYISGNFRYPHTCEWAGTATIDSYGNIECAADIPDEVYSEIEFDIGEGKDRGRVELSDGLYYLWSVED